MKSKLLAVFVSVIGLCIVSSPIHAHHGSSVYDSKSLTTLKGTVTDFQFVNPHTELYFDVKDASGKIEKWAAEASSLTTMARFGWTRNILKPGDQITVEGNRAKNGSYTMRLHKVVLPSGKVTTLDRGEDYADQ